MPEQGRILIGGDGADDGVLDHRILAVADLDARVLRLLEGLGRVTCLVTDELIEPDAQVCVQQLLDLAVVAEP